jgi:hypothetical protein
VSLRATTLGVALAHVDFGIREDGGNNRGAMIRRYLGNLEPPMKEGAPWCAAFVQFCADVAARGRGVSNPLDAVKLEAFVQSYYDEFRVDVLGPRVLPEPGDLVLFKFNGSERWNHIGLVSQPPVGSVFITVEGNTGDVSQRDGDGVYKKPRDSSKYPTCFIRWAA